MAHTQTVPGVLSASVLYRPVVVCNPGPALAVAAPFQQQRAGSRKCPQITGNRSLARGVSGNNSRCLRSTTRDTEPQALDRALSPPDLCLLAIRLAHGYKSPTPTSHHTKVPRARWLVDTLPKAPEVLAVIPAHGPATGLSATRMDTTATTPPLPPAAAESLHQQTMPIYDRRLVVEADLFHTWIAVPPGVSARRLLKMRGPALVRVPVPALAPQLHLHSNAPAPAGDRVRPRRRPRRTILMGRLWVRGPLPLRRWGFRRARPRVIV